MSEARKVHFARVTIHRGRSARAIGLALGAALLPGSPVEAAEPVRATTQMVVAANPHASKAGIDVLRAGGNAVDAAIAVQLVLSLVEPQSSGIGGGAFMLYFDAPGAEEERARIIAYQGRETAPAGAGPDMFLDEDGRQRPFPSIAVGGVSVGVPGVMRMLELAHREHGRLAWEDLFSAAIELAEQGFEISPRLHFLLDQYKGFVRLEGFRAHYYDADGEPLQVGHRLVDPEYASTLRTLAADGAKAMYTGSLARAIVQAVRANSAGPGAMTMADLEGYAPQELAPLCTTYRRWRVCGPQLPSSGGITVQQILGILGSFDVAATRNDPVGAIHLVAEASRLAYADRDLYLADDRFVDVPVAGLLDPRYLAERAALIRADRAMSTVQPGSPGMLSAWRFAPSKPRDLPSTTHFSIIDRWGDAVTMTSSVQMTFGSQLRVGGFLLNNQLTDFSMDPVGNGRPPANRPEPGKSPLSSMAPTMVLDEDGRLRVMVGSPGGTRIIAFVAQTLVNVLDWGNDIQEAVEAPHFVARDGPIELEGGTRILEHRAGLEALGHQVRQRNLNSGLHGIVIDYTDAGTVLWGGADPRREGVALGD